jgi:putative ABC transport system permease protein
MFVFVNALKAIVRSKGRNVLVGLVVAVIAASACVALSIRHAAATAEASGLEQLEITATLGVSRQMVAVNTDESGAAPSFDRDSWQEQMAQYPELTLEELLGHAQSSFVAGLRYSGTASLDTTGDVEAVTDEADTDEAETTDEGTTGAEQPGQGPGGMPGGGGRGAVIFGGFSLGDVQVVGYGSEDAMTTFTNGAQAITSGTMLDLAAADATCLVTEDFATFNSLQVGDTITLANPAAESETYDLVIAGLYSAGSSTTTTSGFGGRGLTMTDPANQVIVSYPTLAGVAEQSQAVATETTDVTGNSVSTAVTVTVSSTFVFASPDDMAAFDAELRAGGLADAYTLTSTDLDRYNSSLVPLRDLASFATTLLWIVLGVGGVILVVITVFNIRERKYEVGVLTAIGIGKPKVALQFVAEVGLVSLAAVVVGLGVGAAVSVPVADRLLSSQVAQQEAVEQSTNETFGRGPVQAGGGDLPTNLPGGLTGTWNQAVSYVSDINATVDFAVVGQLAAIGFALIVVASAAGVVSALRYDPLTILANRA